MRLGIAYKPPHSSPDEWAEKLSALGMGAAVLPCGSKDPDTLAAEYVKASKSRGITIAEVGAWCNPLSSDPRKRDENIAYCAAQLKLADSVGARCCVNIAGTPGEVWDGGYKENYLEDTFLLIRDTVREIIDTAKPTRTYYALEPMPWMVPDSPECYVRLLEAVGRERFAVHMDAVNMISSPERYFKQREFLADCFRLLGPKIKSCHVKDIKLSRRLTSQLSEVPPGEGEFELDYYASLAEAADPDMPFIIEHLPDEAEYLKAAEYTAGVIRRQGIILK